MNCSTVYAGVKILARAGYFELEIADPAEAVRQTRFALSQPVIVTDADTVNVGEIARSFLEDHVIQSLTPTLLHSLKAHFDIDRQVEVEFLVSFNDAQPENINLAVECE